jgi:hypothetical protein
MTPAQAAWCMKEFLEGRTQRDIGEQLHRTGGWISISLNRFYLQFGWWSNEFLHVQDYNERRNLYYRQALDNYLFGGFEIIEPMPREINSPYSDFMADYIIYGLGRAEHAWLLRAEGLSYSEIGYFMGVSRERARQLILKFSRKMSWAMRRTRFRIE